MASFKNDRIIGSALLLPTTAAPDAVFGPIGSITINNVSFMHAYGTNNTFLGANAGNYTLTSTGSVGIGTGALANIGSGNNNVAVGLNAASAYTTIEAGNICIGNVGVVLDSATTRLGTSQTKCFIAGVVGVTVPNPSASVVVDTVTGQFGVGSGGGGITTIDGDTSSITGATVSIKGASTAGSSVSFTGNGATAMTFNVTDSGFNTFIGINAGNATAVANGAQYNSGYGDHSLNTITSGASNTCYGRYSGVAITSASNNTLIGQGAGGGIISTNANTALGSAALQQGTGSNNTCIGFQSAASLTSGSQCAFLGYNTGLSYSGSESNNTLLGYNVVGVLGESNVIRLGNTSHATCFIQGIYGMSPASPQMVTINSAGLLGSQVIPSGITTIDGDSGSATGSIVTFNAAGNTKAGVTVAFVASGTAVSLNVTDANGNTIIGGGNAVNSGQSNVGIGQSVLGNCIGNNNMAVGAASLFALTSGSDNVAIGQHSLYGGGGVGITSGSRNIGIGSNVGGNYRSGESDNILFGYNNSGVLGESNVFRVGNATGTGSGNLNAAYIQGIYGMSPASPQMVTINSAGLLGSQVIPSSSTGKSMIGSPPVAIFAVTTSAVYYPAWGVAAALTAALSDQPMPFAATLSNMYLKITANASTTDTAFTLYVNGVPTALTVTVTALTTGSFSNIIDSVSVSAGDLICIQAAQTTTGNMSGLWMMQIVA